MRQSSLLGNFHNLFWGVLLFPLQVVADTSSATTIPFRRETQNLPEQSLTAVLLTIGLLLALAVALYYLKRRFPQLYSSKLPPSGRMAVVERLHLNSKLSIYVLRYRDREILIAHSGNDITRISEIPLPTSPASMPDICQPLE